MAVRLDYPDIQSILKFYVTEIELSVYSSDYLDSLEKYGYVSIGKMEWYNKSWYKISYH